MTQSPSISLFPLIFVAICEIIIILRPSILFSITTDEIKGLMIRRLENLSLEKFSSSPALLALLSGSGTAFLFNGLIFPWVGFKPLGTWLWTVFAVHVYFSSFAGFLFTFDLLSSAFPFPVWWEVLDSVETGKWHKMWKNYKTALCYMYTHCSN